MGARQWAARSAVAALAALAGGCSSCYDDPWQAAVTYIADAEAGTSLPAPNCEVSASPASLATPAADPNLVEIAKLEIERDCYRNAEASARQQLQRVQQTYAPLK